MSDHDPTASASSADSAGPSGPMSDLAPVVDAPSRDRRGWSRTEIIGVVIAAVLAVGVVVLALDMKFQADQARWQQRQTCLEWYQLQADYGVGPWYQKLPAAAADCGGDVSDRDIPLVPGGNAPAVEPGEDRYVPSE